MKRLLIVVLIATLGQARADSFYVGGLVNVFAPSVVVGFENDHHFGARLVGGPNWNFQGFTLATDVYGQWWFENTQFYTGLGAATSFGNVFGESQVAFVATEVLVGLNSKFDFGEIFLDFAPGLAIQQNPPPNFSLWNVTSFAFLLRLELGIKFRF